MLSDTVSFVESYEQETAHLNPKAPSGCASESELWLINRPIQLLHSDQFPNEQLRKLPRIPRPSPRDVVIVPIFYRERLVHFAGETVEDFLGPDEDMGSPGGFYFVLDVLGVGS